MSDIDRDRSRILSTAEVLHQQTVNKMLDKVDPNLTDSIVLIQSAGDGQFLGQIILIRRIQNDMTLNKHYLLSMEWDFEVQR